MVSEVRGTHLVGGDFSYVGTLSTGWMLEGDIAPSAGSIVTSMDDALLASAFLQLEGGGDGESIGDA